MNPEFKDYNEALEWLYSQLPMFSRVGAAAYKPGLDTSEKLDTFFGHPHRRFRSIHVAGTNGKGSTSNMIASVLQQQGYKTGLYTSPHLADFRERIRIDGKMVSKEDVLDFINRFRKMNYDGHPSFFELTMMLAFDIFAKNNVDIAVIEVGMGGRLDSTNIISPVLSVITNISFDHTQFLGDTLEKIAVEKAGIIKKGIPVVIGEAEGEIRRIFEEKAAEVGAPIIFASDRPALHECEDLNSVGWKCEASGLGSFTVPLGGNYQPKNINTALVALDELRKTGIEISVEAEKEGMQNVIKNTGFAGRWQKICDNPLTICDTGHNLAGITSNMAQLRDLMETGRFKKLRMVIGFVNDKDVAHIVNLFPKEAEYYFTQASVPRAMPVDTLRDHFAKVGITGKSFPNVKSAVSAAKTDASPSDIIFIGGSTFIVADYLT